MNIKNPILPIIALIVAVVLAIAGQTLLNIAVTAISLLGYVVLGAAVIYMLPLLFLALGVGKHAGTSFIIKADPLSTLKVELEKLTKYIADQHNKVASAEGGVVEVKRIYAASKSSFSADKQKDWEERIRTQDIAISKAKDAIQVLVASRRDLQLEIQAAEAELKMVEASSAVSKTLTGSSDMVLSENRRQAIDAISQRVSTSKALLNNAIAQYEEMR